MIEVDNPDGSKWFYHNDHLGSTTLITDEDGNIVEETFYTPFGQNTAGGVEESYYLYTNQFKDAIGCYDYGARVYCPEWYHFTSADPVIASVYDPQGLNHYSYVKNNPYKYVDPSGKRIKKSGARGSYAPSGHWSSKYGGSGGKGGGGSFYVSYWIEGRDEETKVKISEKTFEGYQEKAKQYADTSVYAQHFSDDRDIEQEYLVYLLELGEEGGYEYRSYKQMLVQSQTVQSGLSIGGSLLTAEVGGIGGGAVTYLFANADIQEKMAKGERVTKNNYEEAIFDIGFSLVGGNLVKSSAKTAGIKVTESVTTDLAAETTAEVGYQSGKYAYNYFAKGDEK